LRLDQKGLNVGPASPYPRGSSHRQHPVLRIHWSPRLRRNISHSRAIAIVGRLPIPVDEHEVKSTVSRSPSMNCTRMRKDATKSCSRIRATRRSSARWAMAWEYQQVLRSCHVSLDGKLPRHTSKG